MKKLKVKIIVILILIVVLFYAPCIFNYLISIGDTPQITDYDVREWYGGYYSSNPYTFYTYYLHDDTRRCHLGGSETFYIMKKEKSISPDDYCEHCNMKWSWHFKK